MKKAMLACVFMSGLYSQACASDYIDAHDWSRMNSNEKYLYLRGAREEAMLAPLLLRAQGYGAVAQEVVAPLHESGLSSFSVSYPEIMVALDVFYTNASNADIPVLFALRWVRLRTSGAPVSEQNAEAARLCSVWAKDGKPK